MLSYEELDPGPEAFGLDRLLRIAFMGESLEAHLFAGGILHTATLWFTSTCCAWRPTAVRNNWNFIQPGQDLFCGACRTYTRLRAMEVLHRPIWINTRWSEDQAYYLDGLDGTGEAREWLDSWGVEFGRNPLELRLAAEDLFEGLEEELRRFPLPKEKPGEAW